MTRFRRIIHLLFVLFASLSITAWTTISDEEHNKRLYCHNRCVDEWDETICDQVSYYVSSEPPGLSDTREWSWYYFNSSTTPPSSSWQTCKGYADVANSLFVVCSWDCKGALPDSSSVNIDLDYDTRPSCAPLRKPNLICTFPSEDKVNSKLLNDIVLSLAILLPLDYVSTLYKLPNNGGVVYRVSVGLVEQASSSSKLQGKVAISPYIQ